MPNYEVKIRLADQTTTDVHVTAPSHNDAPDEAMRSLDPKKRDGAVVEGVNRTDVVSTSQQRRRHE